MADGNAYTQAINNAVSSARSMLGKNEVPDEKELQSYLHDGGQDLDPHKAAWCAAFVSASLQKAGLPIPTQVIKDSAYGPGAWAPNYQSYGSAVEPKSIQSGDILVANNGHHVGFAEGPIRQGQNGPEVQMLAGNEADTSGQYAPGAGRGQVGMVGERWVPLSDYSARRYQPPDGSDATINTTSPSILDTMRQNIGTYESGNDYNILGKRTNTGDQAVGRYQVMKSNIPSWTQRWLGHTMTPDEFRADPKAQDAVFNGEFGSYLASYSPADASSKWFTGLPLSQGANKKDILGTSGARYVASTIKGVDNPYAVPGTTLTSVSSDAGPGIGSGIPTPAQPNAAAVAAETPPPNLNPFQKLFTRPEPTKDAQGNDVQGKSPIEKIASGLGGKQGGQQQQAAAPQPAQFAPVQDPMAQMAGPAAQLYSTVQAQAAKPLSWSSRPYGWDAGLQMTPGMSLNTTGYG